MAMPTTAESMSQPDCDTASENQSKSLSKTPDGNAPRRPERAYTKVPYRSPSAPVAEPNTSTIDKLGSPSSSSSTVDSKPRQIRSVSQIQNEPNVHLRGGTEEEACCVLCVCCYGIATSSAWSAEHWCSRWTFVALLLRSRRRQVLC